MSVKDPVKSPVGICFSTQHSLADLIFPITRQRTPSRRKNITCTLTSVFPGCVQFPGQVRGQMTGVTLSKVMSTVG